MTVVYAGKDDSETNIAKAIPEFRKRQPKMKI